jgi:hypothetical protein
MKEKRKKKEKENETENRKTKRTGPTRPAHTTHGGVRRAVAADLIGV